MCSINTNITMGTYSQIKQSIPLYSDLAELLLEYLEPCLDFKTSKCLHKEPYCKCGYRYEFNDSFSSASNQWEKILLENFCPICAAPNNHTTLKIDSGGLFSIPLRRSTHLNCKRCNNSAESYSHKFCSRCQAPFESDPRASSVQEKVDKPKWLWEGGIFEAKHHEHPGFTKLPRKDQLFILRMSWFAKNHGCYIKWSRFDKQRIRLERESIALSQELCDLIEERCRVLGIEVPRSRDCPTAPLLEKLWLKHERDHSLLAEKMKKLETQRKEVFSYCATSILSAK